VVAIGPDGADAMRRYFEGHAIPFRGIPDPGGELLRALGQEWRLLAFGRMPALLAYARDGREVTRHLGRSARDLGDLDTALAQLRSP
jgi:peroxiredoxin Q/BCP